MPKDRDFAGWAANYVDQGYVDADKVAIKRSIDTEDIWVIFQSIKHPDVLKWH